MSSNTTDADARTDPPTFCAVPEETVRTILERARRLDPDDPRVTDHTGSLIPLTGQHFNADLLVREPSWSLQASEDDEITVAVHRGYGTPDGDADVFYAVTADPDSHEVLSVTVSASLVRPA